MKKLTNGTTAIEPSEIVGPGQRFKKEVEGDRVNRTLKDVEDLIRNITPLPIYRLVNDAMRELYSDKPYINPSNCRHPRKRLLDRSWFCRDCGERLAR